MSLSDDKENLGKTLNKIVSLSTELGIKIGKNTDDGSANLELEKIMAFSTCWILFGLVSNAVEKIISKKEFSAMEVRGAIESLREKLKKANDMNGLQEIVKNLM